MHKVRIVTTKIQQHPVARCSDGLRQKRRGRAAATWLALGSKQVPGRSSRFQVAGPGESLSAHRHQLMRLLMSDTSSSACRHYIMRNLLSETSLHEESVVRNLISWLFVPFLSFFCQHGIPGCLGNSHVLYPLRWLSPSR